MKSYPPVPVEDVRRCLASRQPHSQPFTNHRLVLQPFNQVRALTNRVFSTLILPPDELHPSGISCNNVPETRNVVAAFSGFE